MAQFGNTRGRGGQRGGRGGRGGGRGGRGGGKGAIAPKLPAELREKVDGGNPGYQGKPGNYKKDRDFSRPRSDRDRVGEGQGRVRDSESRAERPRPQPQQRQEEPQAGPSRLPYKSTKAAIPVTSSKKKEKAVVIEEAPPKKKKKRELRLPNAPTDDKEDGEIEWLEYTLRNEKGKGKEEESDGLDGMSLHCVMYGRLS
jgi:nucleolar MIF4G domain-containing protein 1